MSKIGGVVAQVLIAGAIGTISLVIIKLTEREITNGKQDTTMADAALGILDIEIKNKKRVTKQIQWIYGTCWGIPRALLSMVGLKDFLQQRFISAL